MVSGPSVFMPGYVSDSQGGPKKLTGGILYDSKLAEHFTEAGWNVRCFDLEGMPRYAKFLKFPATGILRRESGAFDILITDLGNSALTMGFQKWARRRGILTAMICHHFRSGLEESALKRLLYRLSEKSVVSSADILIANSPHTRRILLSMGRRDNEIVLAPPGLNYMVADRRTIKDSPREILAVCSIEPRKGILEMVRALHATGLEEARMTIAGELNSNSEYTQSVRRLIKDLDLESKVILPGRIDDEQLHSLYERADVYMLLSKWEGYGMSIAEAMAHGIPLVTTNAGAIPDLIDHGVSGMMVDPEDWRMAAEYLNELFSNYDLRKRLSESALEAARGFPSWKDTAERVFEAVSESYERTAE